MLCFKGAGTLSREETETEIDAELFAKLEHLIGKPLIRKERRGYRLPGGLTLEVNCVDPDLPTAFWYAEVEFETEAQALAWDPAAAGLADYLHDECTGKPGSSMGEYWLKTAKIRKPSPVGEAKICICKISAPTFTNAPETTTMLVYLLQQENQKRSNGMKRVLLVIAALLSLTVLLAACKKSGDTISTPAAESTPATVEATPAPTELPPYEANVLTGEPKGADYPEGQRITAVMVNNIVGARPQRGLSKADILFEIKVEGGITRFMPVFTDYKTVGEVGPVRSGRDQFFRLILPWQALYIHEGQSVVMQQYAIDYDYGKLNNNDGANGYRDYGRVNWAGKSYNAGSLALEHTMYTNSDNIANYISSQNVDMNRTYNSTFFNFVDYRLGTTRDLSNSLDSAYSDKYGPVVSDGQYIEIEHSQSYKTRFIYDESANEYKMQQNYSDGQWRDTVDEAADNKVLTFPNVIVLYTDIHTYPGHEAKDLQYVEYAWGGIGYYCYGGKCEKIYWQKGTPLEALRLYYLNEDGTCSDTPLEVNIGKSYVAVTDVDFAGNFVHSTLDGVNLSTATTQTYEKSYVEDDAKAGETLGSSTDDLTAAATGQRRG